MKEKTLDSGHSESEETSETCARQLFSTPTENFTYYFEFYTKPLLQLGNYNNQRCSLRDLLKSQSCSDLITVSYHLQKP